MRVAASLGLVTTLLAGLIPPTSPAQTGLARPGPFKAGDGITALAFSPDGTLLAGGGHDQVIWLWDRKDGDPVGQLHGHTGSVYSLSFSPDGKYLASGSGTPEVILWDVANQKLLRRIEVRGSFTYPVAFLPDGKALAGMDGPAVCLWDPATGKKLREYRVEGWAPAHALAVAPDGKTLAAVTGQRGGTTRVDLWDVASGKPLPPWEASAQRGRCHALAFSPDGKTLAAGWGGGLWLRPLDSGREREVKEQPHGAVTGVVFTPDGRTVVAVSANGTALYEVLTGELRSFHEVNARSESGVAAVSAEGQTLAWGFSRQRFCYREELRPRSQTPPERLSPADLDRAWTWLSAGADKGPHAIAVLSHAPGSSLPYLKERLRPVPPLPDGRLARLVTDLQSDQFAVREKATEELEHLGDAAEGALLRLLAGKPPLDTARRAEGLLQKLEGPAMSAERRRLLRCVEVLERIGTPEAKELLAHLSRGAPEARLTSEATASLARLGRKANGR